MKEEEEEKWDRKTRWEWSRSRELQLRSALTDYIFFFSIIFHSLTFKCFFAISLIVMNCLPFCEVVLFVQPVFEILLNISLLSSVGCIPLCFCGPHV